MQETDDLQPWVPDEIAKLLRVGARVRVRLSGECSIIMKCCGMTTMCHELDVEGRVGTIVPPEQDDTQMRCKGCGYIDQHPEAHGHNYWVLFDYPLYSPYYSMRYDGSVFAASELEPIDENP